MELTWFTLFSALFHRCVHPILFVCLFVCLFSEKELELISFIDGIDLCNSRPFYKVPLEMTKSRGEGPIGVENHRMRKREVTGSRKGGKFPTLCDLP